MGTVEISIEEYVELRHQAFLLKDLCNSWVVKGGEICPYLCLKPVLLDGLKQKISEVYGAKIEVSLEDYERIPVYSAIKEKEDSMDDTIA